MIDLALTVYRRRHREESIYCGIVTMKVVVAVAFHQPLTDITTGLCVGFVYCPGSLCLFIAVSYTHLTLPTMAVV